MHIFIKTGFLLLCFIVLNTHAHAIEEFEKYKDAGRASPFKDIIITIRSPALYRTSSCVMTDCKGEITLNPTPDQKELLIGMDSDEEEKITINKKERKNLPIRINYSTCNLLNDYGNLVLRAYIDATNMRNNRRDEFHQLYQGFYDLITSNEDGKIILKDIIEPALHNLQIMDRIKTVQNHEIPTLIASLIIVSPLIEKPLEIQSGNSTTQLMQPKAQSFARSFSVDYLTHPIATGSLSFMIVGGIGYVTTDPRSALVYATIGGMAAYILPQLYNYQAKYKVYSF